MSSWWSLIEAFTLSTVFWDVRKTQCLRDNWKREAADLSTLLRSGEMPIHLGNADPRFENELSSRPERSGVERSAVPRVLTHTL
jgi:hypothetical protein